MSALRVRVRVWGEEGQWRILLPPHPLCMKWFSVMIELRLLCTQRERFWGLFHSVLFLVRLYTSTKRLMPTIARVLLNFSAGPLHTQTRYVLSQTCCRVQNRKEV